MNAYGKKLQLTANSLKIIAIIAMTINHIWFTFWFNDPSFEHHKLANIIGFIPAPMMLYFAVEGYHHTRNIKVYLKRLAVFAVISWFPFWYFMNSGNLSSLSFYSLISPMSMYNVIFTIFLGVLAIYVRRNIENIFAKIILILLLFVASYTANWGGIGIIITLIFDAFYANFKKQALAYSVFSLLASVGGIVSGDFTMLGMLIPIILLYFYNGQRGRGGALMKWFFYIYYPLHLLILGFIGSLMA